MHELKFKPIAAFLGPLGDEERGTSRADASYDGAQVAAMMETPGWEILMQKLKDYQRHEQLTLMRSNPGKASDGTYERIIGQWAGLERVVAIAEGVVGYGKLADAELESGQSAGNKEASSG